MFITIFIKSEVWPNFHCLGLCHETMACTACLFIFLKWDAMKFHLLCQETHIFVVEYKCGTSMVVSTVVLKFGNIDLASSFIITTKYKMSSRIGLCFITETDCTASRYFYIWSLSHLKWICILKSRVTLMPLLTLFTKTCHHFTFSLTRSCINDISSVDICKKNVLLKECRMHLCLWPI